MTLPKATVPWLGSWTYERLALSFLIFLTYSLYIPLTNYTRSLVPVDVSMRVDELIPLDPQWIVVYAMIYFIAVIPLFVVWDPRLFRRVFLAFLTLEIISFMLFILVPVHMNLRPPISEVTGDDFFSWATRLCYVVDHPTCCFPSLHVGVSVLAALCCWKVDRVVGRYTLLIAGLISLSTLMIKQHFLADVLLGGVLAMVCYRVFIIPITPVPLKNVESSQALQRVGILGVVATYLVVMIALFIVYLYGWEPT